MPTKQYNIIISGVIITKFTRSEFDRICSGLDILEVVYTTEIIDLTKK